MSYRVWTNALSSKFSWKEMVILFNIKDKCIRDSLENKKIQVSDIAYTYNDRYVLHLDDEPTMLEPIENMPLYINDDDAEKRAMAIFRLQVGR